MKISEITNRIKLSTAVSAAAMLTLVACSDKWDDHYGDAAASGNQSGETLWAAIEKSGNLKNFAAVLRATGYDRILNGDQSFTVFAPVDDKFTKEQADSIIEVYNQEKAQGLEEKNNEAIKQFVQNHIALYYHSVSTDANYPTQDTITMMNGKHIFLNSTRFDTQEMLTRNTHQKNGVLFTIADKESYFPNVYEYLKKDPLLSNVYDFLHTYDSLMFEASLSTEGEFVDGKMQYIDSVKVLTNELLSDYGLINNEDSTYWFVAPTNTLWDNMVTTYTNYFNYDNTVANRDSLTIINTRKAILGGLFFSNTVQRFNMGDENPKIDSLLSTSYRKNNWEYYKFLNPTAANGLLSGLSSVRCSNGRVYLADKLNAKPTETFMQPIKVECEEARYLLEHRNALQPESKTVGIGGRYDQYHLSSNKVLEVYPTSPQSTPYVEFQLSNTLSAVPYDIYVVMAPVEAYDTLSTDTLPTSFYVSIYSMNQRGQSRGENLGKSDPFVTKPHVIDTVLITDPAKGIKPFEFNTSSYGLSEIKSKIRLTSSVSRDEVNNRQRTKTMRIDCIILKPHEDE